MGKHPFIRLKRCFSSTTRRLDLCFCVDLTKSMQPFLDAAQRHFDKLLVDLIKAQISLRLGIVGFRDFYPPELDPDGTKPRVFDIYDFTSDKAQMGKMVNSLHESPVGNSDVCEAVLCGIRASCEELKWNSDGKKVMILVGDAPPHGCGGKQIAQQTTDPFGFRRRKTFNRGDNYPDGDPCEWTISTCIKEMNRKGITMYSLALLPSMNPQWDDLTARTFTDLAKGTGGWYQDARDPNAAVRIIRDICENTESEMEFDETVLQFYQMGLKNKADISRRMGTKEADIDASLRRLSKGRHISS